MRTAILTIQDTRGLQVPLLNVYGDADQMRKHGVDLVANGYFDIGDLLIVRLPRRLGVDRCHCVSRHYIWPRRHEDGSRNYNVS
jgi:hypothetical protein